MSDENLAEIRNEKAKKVQHPKGKLTAYERVELLLDEGSFSEIDQHVASEENPEGEAVITGTGTIHGRPVFVFSEDFSVMGGSLGEVVAKKILKIIEWELTNESFESSLFLAKAFVTTKARDITIAVPINTERLFEEAYSP